MATPRSKGGTGRRAAAPAAAGTEPALHTRTRAPEDEIGGVAAPSADAPAAPGAKTPGRSPRAVHHSGVAAKPTGGETATPKKRGKGKRETYAETAARRKREKEVDQLQADLRAFAIARPGGWDHNDWQAFLGHLGERGHDTSDAAAIGSRLERERLAVVLGGIQGLGPKRVDALVSRFETLWTLRHAGEGEIAAVPGMNRAVAAQVTEELRKRFS